MCRSSSQYPSPTKVRGTHPPTHDTTSESEEHCVCVLKCMVRFPSSRKDSWTSNLPVTFLGLKRAHPPSRSPFDRTLERCGCLSTDRVPSTRPGNCGSRWFRAYHRSRTRIHPPARDHFMNSRDRNSGGEWWWWWWCVFWEREGGRTFMSSVRTRTTTARPSPHSPLQSPPSHNSSGHLNRRLAPWPWHTPSPISLHTII